MKRVIVCAGLAALVAGCGFNADFVRSQQAGMELHQLKAVVLTPYIPAIQRDLAREEIARRLGQAVDDGKLEAAAAADIEANRVRLGMSKPEVIAAWGTPDDIHRTVTRYGTREQWVFGTIYTGRMSYVYFEDGRVSSISG